MEDKYVHGTNGQETGQEDLNLLGENAALADDRVLAELFRLVPYDGVTVRRAVIPYVPYMNAWGTPNLARTSLVRPSGSSDAKVRVGPCRAIIGSRASTPLLTKWRDIRSAILVGSSDVWDEIQLAETSSSNRWDLVYARVDVDIDDSNVTRYVRAADRSVSAQSVVVRKKTTVTLGVVAGTEDANPGRPSLPSDTGSAYYIPLAFVLLTHPHTLTTAIAPAQIYECAPILPLSPATGALSISPANMLHKDGGPIVNHAARAWNIANGRPNEYLPAAMVGGFEKFLPLDFINADPTFPLGVATIIEESVDWRCRLFTSTVFASSTRDFPWVSGTTCVPNAIESELGVTLLLQMGQSFTNDSGMNGGLVMQANSGNLTQIATNSYVTLYADITTGKLMAYAHPTISPAVRLFIWVRATGQYGNVW